MSTNEETKNPDVTATELIIAAAKKSGLLQEVAVALCFFDKWPYETRPLIGNPWEELRDDLAEAFDNHIGLPVNVIESFCDVGDPVYTKAELAPYLA